MPRIRAQAREFAAKRANPYAMKALEKERQTGNEIWKMDGKEVRYAGDYEREKGG